MSLIFPFKPTPPVLATPMEIQDPEYYTKKAAIKNSNGWYKRGLVAWEGVTWTIDSQVYIADYGYGVQQHNAVYKSSVILDIPNQNPELRMCLFKIPLQYYYEYFNSFSKNYAGTAARNAAEVYDWCVDYVKDNPLYFYLLVRNFNDAGSNSQLRAYGLYNNSDTDKLYSNNLTSSTQYSYAVGDDVNYHSVKTVLSNYVSFTERNNSAILEQFSGVWKRVKQTYFDKLNDQSTVSYNKINDEIKKYLKYDTSKYQPFSNDLIADLSDAFDKSDILSSLRLTPFDNMLSGASNQSFSYLRTNGGMLSANIITDLPIFSLPSIDEMENYFGNKKYTPDNKDDLVQSLVDLPTRWDVYINGNNRPEVTVEYHCSAWERWQGDPEANTQGLAKDNAIAQFDTAVGGTVGGNDIFSGSTGYVPLDTLHYDDSLSTDYIAMLDNTVGANVGIGSLTYANWSIDRLYDKGAYMHMQLVVLLSGIPIFSRIAECCIGVIGNPELDDFSKNIPANYGKILGISDGSEIHLHYNEQPPGTDDGTKPDIKPPKPSTPPPMPPKTEIATTVLTKTYRVPEPYLRAFGNFLWNADFRDNIALINNSPIENVVSVFCTPFFIEGTPTTISVGNVATNISAYEISTVPIFKVGEIDIEGAYKSFLDYAPYTELYLFLPFIGFYGVDCNLYMGKHLDLYYALDILHGAVKALIYLDNVYVQSFDGSGGVDIELNASNKAQRSAQILQSALSLVPKAISTAGSVKKAYDRPTNKSISKAKDNIGELATDAYQAALNGIFAPYHSQRTGAYSPRCGEFEPNMAFLAIDYPSVFYPAQYNHIKGKPLNQTCVLGQIHGYTICAGSIDLTGFKCTETEKDMILSYLYSGVYL